MTIRILGLLLFTLAAVPSGWPQEASETSSTQAAPAPAEPVIEPAQAAAPANEAAGAAASVQTTAAASSGTADTETTGSASATKASRNKKQRTANAKPGVLQPTFLYVSEGCEACAGLLKYLREAGVTLSISKVEPAKCSLFPTVIYSDGMSDHGERIYMQQVPLPRKLGVEECGTGA